MKNKNNSQFIYLAISAAVLICNAVLIVFADGAALTRYSAIPAAFAVGAVIYALIAFTLRDKGNLFTAGRHWFYKALSLTFSDHSPDTQSGEYKKEFAYSAFVYCITVPFYMTLSFFADSYFEALSHAVALTVVRQLTVIIAVLIPLFIRSVNEAKQQHIKDEADRKAQERRESMGKWK